MCHVYFVSRATVVRMKYMLQIQSIISMIKDLETPKNKIKKNKTPTNMRQVDTGYCVKTMLIWFI